MKKTLITITVLSLILSLMLSGCGQSYAESAYAALLGKEYKFGRFNFIYTNHPSFEAFVSTKDDMLNGPFQTYLLEYGRQGDCYTVGYLDSNAFDGSAPVGEDFEAFLSGEDVVDGKALRNYQAERPDTYAEGLAWYDFALTEEIPAMIHRRRAAIVLRSKDVIVKEILNTGRELGHTIKYFGRVFMKAENGVLRPCAGPEDMSAVRTRLAEFTGSSLFVTDRPLVKTEMFCDADWHLVRNILGEQFIVDIEQNSVQIGISREWTAHASGFGRYLADMDAIRLAGTDDRYDYRRLKELILRESANPHKCTENITISCYYSNQ